VIEIALHHLSSIVTFGNVLMSPYLIHRCGEDGRSLVWLSEYGKFKARTSGSTTGNVLLRQAQYQALNDPIMALAIARNAIAGKLQNTRSMVMRAAREATHEADKQSLTATAQVHADAIQKAESTPDLDTLRGIEGYAAKTYFGSFSCMIRANRETFKLLDRNKRPPRVLVATACKDYGQRVQLSVFECRVSDSQYETLLDRLVKTIEPLEDSLRVYRLPAPREEHLKCFGKDGYTDFDQPLII
jgi:CRISPR-associated endonuclease Cas2